LLSLTLCLTKSYRFLEILMATLSLLITGTSNPKKYCCAIKLHHRFFVVLVFSWLGYVA
jgi:hypothetical protein